MEEPYKLFTDGSFFPYLKRSGIGGYLLDPLEKEVFCFSEVVTDEDITIVTNQPFEILAVEKGLKLAQKYGIKSIICHSDDESLCDICNTKNSKQIEQYVERNKHLKRIFNITESFDNISFQYINRNKNIKADLLSREAFKTISHKRHFKKSKNSFSVPGIYFAHPENYRERHLIHYKRKQCRDFLIFKISPKGHDLNYLTIYHAHKNEDKSLKYELITNKQLNKNWMPDVVESIAQTIFDSPLQFLSFYVLGHHQQIFEDIFIGFNDITQRTADSFINLKKSIEMKDCVLYYQDSDVLFKIFGSKNHNLNEAELLDFLFNGLKTLGKKDYQLGSHPEIENFFTLSGGREKIVSELQKKYFGHYVKAYLRFHHYNLKNSADIKKIIEFIRQDLKMQGIFGIMIE